MESTVQSFMEYVRKIRNYHEAISTLALDLRTGAPRKGMEQRSEVIGTLSEEAFKMSTSEEMEHYLEISPRYEIEKALFDEELNTADLPTRKV